MSLKPFHQLTSKLKFVFILSRGRTLLILGHMLKAYMIVYYPLHFFSRIKLCIRMEKFSLHN